LSSSNNAELSATPCEFGQVSDGYEDRDEEGSTHR
jgi:hypothetical protein